MSNRDASIPPYNSRNIQVKVRLIEKNYPHLDVERVLDHAGMKRYEVEDDGHWFTQAQIDRFEEMAVRLTGNASIAREAGRFSTSVESHSRIRSYLIGLLGPLSAYKMLGKAGSLVTRATTFVINALSPHSVEVICTPVEGVVEKAYQCENRLGILESIAFTFTGRLPRVDHPECTMRGDSRCRYVVEWEPSVVDALRRVRYVLGAVSVVGSALGLLLLPINDWITLSLVLLAGNYVIGMVTKSKENRVLVNTVEELRTSTEELVYQTNVNYNNSAVSHEVGLVISRHNRITDVLDSVAETFGRQLDYDRGLIMLASADESRLVFRAGFGYSPNELAILEETEFNLADRGATGVFVRSYHDRESFLVNDLDEISGHLSRRSLDFARALGTQSFICCPIVADHEVLGVLAVDNVRTKKPLLNSDLNMLSGMAAVIGMSVKNSRLIESREEQFKSVIRVLASTIDARDSITAGHSEKVTEYSVAIARELGLGREEEDMIRIAALLHDYGKIAIPDSVLKKPGSLTDEEFAVIKTHVSKTKEILDQVAFEGVYAQVPEVAGAHHERLDGRGYPQGLKGDEIPLGGRIIAVADFFEAVTSHRHYRDPLPMGEALALLEREAGSHLDPAVVSAFLSYLERNADQRPSREV
jgi:HD-GYP domain-containing protein (c-di-GMP phosphodiesterase class II)